MSDAKAFVVHLARQNYDAIGFIPDSRVELGLERDEFLFVYENGQEAGYLWHSAARPGHHVSIYQACIDYQARRRHLGASLVQQLFDRAVKGGATAIRLRCASDLDANDFWQAMGFIACGLTPGGEKRNRMIVHWRADIHPRLWTPVTP